jgi:aminoglycoside 3-N-acetyltransferase
MRVFMQTLGSAPVPSFGGGRQLMKAEGLPDDDQSLIGFHAGRPCPRLSRALPGATRKNQGMSLKKEAFYLLRRATSMSMRQNLKSRLWRLRVKCAPLIQAWNGTFSTAELELEIRRHLPNDFDILMVHCSYNSLTPMYRDNPIKLLKAFLRIAGPDRTLAMPAFFFGTPEKYYLDYYRANPLFNVRRTPSQMGIVSELFRKVSGVLRSLHPTHSVCAFGPLADELTRSHHLSSAECGPLSPFGVMARYKTAILGVGTEYYRTLTQVHAIEDHMGPDFPIPREPEEPISVTLIDAASRHIPYVMSPPLSHKFVLKIERLAGFLRPGVLREWKYKGVPFYCVEASEINRALGAAAASGKTLYVPE